MQYAHRQTVSLELFYGDFHNTPVAMDYFVWAITNGERTVVVDLGFTEEVGTCRGRQFLRCPSKGLAEIGIDCARVEHVILSHFHDDHVGQLCPLPKRHILRPGHRDEFLYWSLCAVIASDASHYYHNIEKNVPFLTLHDIPGMYYGFQRIHALADKPELIIPGHDPLVQERLRRVANGIVSLG